MELSPLLLYLAVVCTLIRNKIITVYFEPEGVLSLQPPLAKKSQNKQSASHCTLERYKHSRSQELLKSFFTHSQSTLWSKIESFCKTVYTS